MTGFPTTSPEPASASTPLLALHDLSKRYGDTPVFRNVDLQLQAGEFVALLGESGVGKSTLLNCIAGLDHADSGTMVWRQSPIQAWDDHRRTLWRREHLGFVFQAFHVLPHLSVADNIGLPLRLLGRAPSSKELNHALASVGLAGLGERRPAQLSGGQLQRVAIARALIHRPALILADEPTGNLDPDNAERVLDVLREQTRQHGAACLLVTHAPRAAARADRVVRLMAQGMEAVRTTPDPSSVDPASVAGADRAATPQAA